MLITFPVDGMVDGSLSCQNIYGLASGVSCSKANARTLRVNTLFPSTDEYTLLQINGLKMPASVSQYSLGT
jgi:hypothetical protein